MDRVWTDQKEGRESSSPGQDGSGSGYTSFENRLNIKFVECEHFALQGENTHEPFFGVRVNRLNTEFHELLLREIKRRFTFLLIPIAF